jgi:trans-2,3-dihydro-3-hydroxyanthranilate isomerase
MKDKIKFFITDVFGDGKYTGNQLATFLDSAPISSEEMQQITREVNYSESTFILSREQKDGGYDVRIFTPGEEIDFAGHPTLGTAYIIHKHIIGTPVEKVVLNLRVGQVPVSFPGGDNSGTLWMDQVEPTFRDTMESKVMAEVLNLNIDDIDTRWPIQQVSTGLPFNIVPLKNLDALKRAVVKKDIFWKQSEKWWAKGILVFCPEGYTPQQSLGVRVFVDYYGIPEDPATGSGNGCLAAYLVKHRCLNSSQIDIQTGQGYEIGRPSTLYLRAEEKENKIHISVGGKVISIAEGLWG